MAVGINADAANIPSVNLVVQGSDPAAPGSGHAQLYIKGTTLYVRLDSGDPIAVGGVVTLAEGQLAIGDASDELTALALGTEGQVITADASGMAEWASPAAGGGDVTRLDEQVAPSGGVDTLAFTGIAGTYRLLRLDLSLRSEKASSTFDVVLLRFNTDTGNNYAFQWFASYGGTSTTGVQGQAAPYVQLGYCSAADSPAGAFAHYTLTIPRYASTSMRKALHGTGGLNYVDTSNGMEAFLSAGFWLSTSAITGITILLADGVQLAEGSVATLYGIS